MKIQIIANKTNNWSLRNSTGKLLALQAVHPGLVPSNIYSSLSTASNNP